MRNRLTEEELKKVKEEAYVQLFLSRDECCKIFGEEWVSC